MKSLFVFAVLTAAGCASDDVKFIDFSQSGGIAGFEWTLHIEPDGTALRHRGDEDRTFSLSADTMADLRAKVAAANFPSLDEMYGSTANDDFIYEVKAKVGSASYKVTSSGDTNTPEPLRDLNKALALIIAQD